MKISFLFVCSCFWKSRSYAESKRPLIDDLLSESSTQSTRILMDFIYRKGESHNYPLIPNIEKMDEHLERATKGIVAVLLWHSGLGNKNYSTWKKLSVEIAIKRNFLASIFLILPVLRYRGVLWTWFKFCSKAVFVAIWFFHWHNIHLSPDYY